MPTKRKKSKLFRFQEAARYLDGAITVGTLRQWVFYRKIPSIRVGRAVCIEQRALDDILERGRREAIQPEVPCA